MASSSSVKSLSDGVPESLVGKFTGLTIAVAGKFPSGITHGDLKRLVTALGGTFETQDVARCTHLITASTKLKTIKVSSARKHENCLLVSYDWLCKAILTDDIKELLDQISGLKISDTPLGVKRKHDQDLDQDNGDKERKTAKDYDRNVPVEVLESSTVKPPVLTQLSGSIELLLRLLTRPGYERVIQGYVNHQAKSQNPGSTSALQFFQTLMRETPTADRLSEGLSRLQLKEITALKKDSDEFKILAEYCSKTALGAIGYPPPSFDVFNIMRIERSGESERFLEWSKKHSSTIGDRRLLWHGSYLPNFIGILSQGLCDNAPGIGGRCKGVYLAERSSLSMSFCRVAAKGDDALMLLCEVECGIGMRNLSQRIISGHSEWRDASCVHPNLKGATLADVNKTKGITHVEYVVPNKEQIRQRYLFHLKF